MFSILTLDPFYILEPCQRPSPKYERETKNKLSILPFINTCWGALGCVGMPMVLHIVKK